MNKELNPRQIKTIQNFWNWFQDNEQAIYNAFKLEINNEELLFHLQRNLNNISKRTEIIIYEVSNQNEKLHIMITALGYKKLFPKVITLGDTAPKLKHFTIQTFIKPLTPENFNQIPEGLKKIINKSLIRLDDYKISTKKIKITLYMPVNFEFENEFHKYISGELAIMFTLGEVNYKKHIADFEIKHIETKTNGSLQLSELPEFIDYLSKINFSRKIKIFFE